MTLFKRGWTQTAAEVLPVRGQTRRAGSVNVNGDTAMRHSAVWAAIRLRADLVSSFPIDCFRKVGDLQVEVPKPPVLVEPGGPEWDYVDWIYATQSDLDRAGNTVGLITQRNALGLPARIELVPISTVSIIQRKGETQIRYRIDGKVYSRDQVWHERQFIVSGLPVGLSPVAYAAWSIGEYLSIQDFALDWFASGGVPKARLRNTAKTITPTEADAVKDRWKASVANGDLFVTGSDWEYDMMQAEAMGTEWLEARKAGSTDIARFFGVPADLIDAAVSGSSVTYANVTQRNLQFLIMNLGPAVQRREKNLDKLLPRPRFVKLNTDALLRMDPAARAKLIDTRIKNRTLTVSEARELDNRPPLTPEQEAEFARLFGAARTVSEQATRAQLSPWEQVSPWSAAPYIDSEVS